MSEVKTIEEQVGIPAEALGKRQNPKTTTVMHEAVLVGRGDKKVAVIPKDVELAASYGCPNTEICDMYGIDEKTLVYNFSAILTKARASRKMKLRQLQWETASKGNVTMQIFLGKNELGQSDNPNAPGTKEPLPWDSDTGDTEIPEDDEEELKGETE